MKHDNTKSLTENAMAGVDITEPEPTDYKLCRIEVHSKSKVIPVNEDGEQYLDTLFTFENDEDYYYAIYENLGTDEDEDWAEYDYFEQDFDRAVEAYKKLRGEHE